MPVSYEWNVKEMDYDDIMENYFTVELCESTIDVKMVDDEQYVLELIRYGSRVDLNQDEYEVEREYIETYRTDDGYLYLPEHSESGRKIPKRFHIELASCQVEK